MTQITDYATLQTNIAEFLNRPRLAAKIPTFIQLAEKDVFRIYESLPNEVVQSVDRTSESPLTDTIPLPGDYREMITFTVDRVPLKRASLTEVQGRRSESGRADRPDIFARQLNDFILYPFPDKGYVYELYYFSKLVALSDGNTVNEALKNEPGLYLYASLLKAEPYIKGEEPGLLQVWAAEYQKIIDGIEEERAKEARSGSVVTVQSAFGARPRRYKSGAA